MEFEEAVDQLRARDFSGFAVIVKATSSQLYRLAARILGDLQEAEDVLQESYCRAYEALQAERFDGRSSIQSWLYRIVTNVALDALRAQQRSKRVEHLPVPAPVQPSFTEAHLALKELATWLEALPPRQRAALVLKEFEGLSSAEVGVILECSEGAVEQYLVRARARLRARWEDG